MNLNKVYQRHMRSLMEGFEPMTSGQQVFEELPRCSKRFILPFALYSVIAIDMLVILVQDFDTADPRIFHNTITSHMPGFFQEQVRIVYYAGYAWCTASFYLAIYDPMIHVDYLMTPYAEQLCNKKEILPLKLSQGLKRLHERIANKIRLFSTIVFFELNVCYTFPLYGLELYKLIFVRTYSTNLRRVVWQLLCPLFLRYYVFLLEVISNFLFLNHCLNLKQRFLIDIIDRIMLRIHEKNKADRYFKKWKFRTELKVSKSAQNSVLVQTVLLSKLFNLINNLIVEEDKYNKFYSKYNTLSIGGIASMVAYLVYGVWNAPDEASFVQLMPWSFFSVIYLAYVWVITATCSKTAWLNGKIYTRLRKLGFISGRDLPVRNDFRFWFYLERINRFKISLAKINFKLLDSVPINNRLLFYKIMGFLSFVFLKLFQK